MECCGEIRKTKFCCDCGKKIKMEIRDIRCYLSEILCDRDEFRNVVFINKCDLGKSIINSLVDRRYSGYGLTLYENNEAYMNVVPINRGDGKYNRSIFFDDIQIPYYIPSLEDKLEDVVIGLLKAGVTDPQPIHAIKHNRIDFKCTLVINKDNSSKRQKKDKTKNKQETIQEYYKNKLSFLGLDRKVYLFGDYLYTYTELVNNASEKLEIDVKWDKCIVETHKINKLKVHILDKDLGLLFKKIREYIILQKFKPYVNFKEKIIGDNFW